MSTSITRHEAPTSVRPPLSVRAAILLLPPIVAAHIVGGFLFGVVWADDPVSITQIYLAFAVVTSATAVAMLPRLIRGDRLGWLVVTGWTVAYDYWTVYKVFGMPEYSSLPFLGAGLLLLALLFAPRTRAHVGGVL